MKRSISVVIPNYNGKHLLEQNLPSVVGALERSGAQYEIIIVDDCSTDNSVQFTQENYPQIQLIRSLANKGFSVACNKGITVSKNELTLLLNTDIQLPADYLESQFKYFDDPATFGVMGKVLDFKDGAVQDTARYITFSGFKIKANNFYHLADENFWCPTAYLSGANALVDSQKLKALGGFDEIFSPFYCEDFDLGLKAWRVGWKCYYQPQCYCLHEHSSTTKNIRTRSWVKAIFFRNRLILHAIHLNGLARALLLVQVLFTDVLFRWLSFNFYFYNSLSMFFKMNSQVRTSRRNFKNLMKDHRSDRSISKIKAIMDEMIKGQVVIEGRS